MNHDTVLPVVLNQNGQPNATDQLDATIAEKLRELDKNDDGESSHKQADKLLCEILQSLGFTQTVKAFNEMTKWYA